MSGTLGIAVLGSTGSVGRQCLEVIAAYPERFRLVGLAANRSVALMAEQARKHEPQHIVMGEPRSAEDLAVRLGLGSGEIGVGHDAIAALVQGDDVDLVVAAVVGQAGLPGVCAALRAGKKVAIANKESLVMAGELLVPLLQQGAASLLPVDSEHAALAQLLAGVSKDSVDELILTASGGPFLDAELKDMQEAGPAEALAHPTWNMGAKISIDSATMMNKAFEVIEASWLFGVPEDRIRVLIHPESRVHAALRLRDGSWLAQLGPADMRIPIAQALAHPQVLDLSRRLEDPTRLDLEELGTLSFRQLDSERFPALQLGRQAIAAGKGRPAALCVADEVLVHAFLEERISFGAITLGLDSVMQSFSERRIGEMEDVLEAGREGERLAEAWVRR